MISPAGQKIIQIEVTNACPHQCANCTRFAGHHRQPFMLELDQFKRAVDSLEDYHGMVGMMGGEPTLHPRFAEMVDYMVKTHPDIAPCRDRYGAIKDFVKYRNVFLSSVRNKRGLWTSLGPGYYKHYELIQDSFSYQCVNDHSHAGVHLALLITRKELGIPDKKWFKLRDNCWVQRKWSASITPKGAFFCEVAAALDMLFDGPGGWPVVKDWWRRQPEDFGSQLDWCEMCSACLPVPRSVASSGRDMVSPLMKEKLEKIGSLKLKKGLVDVLNLEEYVSSKYKVNKTYEPYLPDGDNAVRISSTNKSLVPRKIEAVIVCVGYGDYLAITLPFTKNAVDKAIVVTDEEDILTQKVCKQNEVEFIVSKRLHENGAVLAKGKGVNDGLDALAPDDWVLVLDADIIVPVDFSAKIRTVTLNPGALYHSRRWGPVRVKDIEPLMRQLNDGVDLRRLYRRWANKTSAGGGFHLNNAVEETPFGYFHLFNTRANILQGRDKIYSEISDTAEWDDAEFADSVYLRGRCTLLPADVCEVIHLPHGIFRANWIGRKGSLVPGTEKLISGEETKIGQSLTGAYGQYQAGLSVSVIVYASDDGSTIDRCLRAVIDQDFLGKVDIVVVDNMSRDRTFRKASQYPEVRVMRGCYEGRAHARNCAIAKAKGDILLFCDANCQPEKDWITRLTAPFLMDNDIGSVAGGISHVKTQNSVGKYYQFKILFTPHDVLKNGFLRVPPVISNVAYRKVVFQEVGLFDPAFGSACEDFGLWHNINQSRKFKTVSLFGAVVYRLNTRVHTIWRDFFNYYVGLRHWCLFYEKRDYKYQLPFLLFMGLLPVYLMSIPFLFIYLCLNRYPMCAVVFPLYEYIRELASRLGTTDWANRDHKDVWKLRKVVSRVREILSDYIELKFPQKN